MKTLLVLGLLLVTLAAGAVAQDDPAADQAALMETYMKLAQPGPEHEMLSKMAGKWNLTVTIWPAPGADSMVFSGTGENEMILGGRFLQMTSVSGEGEMETHTLHIIGFDRRYNEYNLAGFDDHGTYFVTAKGSQDEKTGKIVMSGEDADPIFGFTQVYDCVLTIDGSDKMTMEWIFKNPELTGGADQFKMVEVQYMPQINH